ncbi:hypothetical protein ACU4GD_33960 [Cupriavidus basilensis]
MSAFVPHRAVVPMVLCAHPAVIVAHGGVPRRPPVVTDAEFPLVNAGRDADHRCAVASDPLRHGGYA